MGDKLSSAHVYLRLEPGQGLETVSLAIIEEAAQLVKHNSIQGNKMNDVDVVYTMWSNLHKTAAMDVGQIGFHVQKAVKKIRVATRENAVINRLNKTKVEKPVDLRVEREEKDGGSRAEKLFKFND